MEIPKSWTFKNHEVADSFDNHVREQLPWYDIATSALPSIVSCYLPMGGLVYDIGASTGNVGRALARLLGERNADLIAVEESKEMIARYDGPGRVINCPAQDVDFERFDVCIFMLTAMFIPSDALHAVLSSTMEACKPGGAVIIVDKFLPGAGYQSQVFRRITLDAKQRGGAKDSQIMQKEQSLAGIQRPLPDRILLSLGGWKWFQFGEFAGYVIEKGADA